MCACIICTYTLALVFIYIYKFATAVFDFFYNTLDFMYSRLVTDNLILILIVPRFLFLIFPYIPRHRSLERDIDFSERGRLTSTARDAKISCHRSFSVGRAILPHDEPTGTEVG